jgi:acyl carrier protein phosphodiesterase
MNFLAHLFLSGDDHDIMIGNFIADSVKGKSYERFSPKIQEGILLHRKIDTFTDKHEITRKLKVLVAENYGKHSGIVIDIFYDHFLSINWNAYSGKSLVKFITKCHRVILRNIFILPSDVKGYLPFLIARKRLQSYSRIEGIENVLELMSKYTSLPPASHLAVEILKNNYSYFNESFMIFFNELMQMVEKELEVKSELIEPHRIKFD